MPLQRRQGLRHQLKQCLAGDGVPHDLEVVRDAPPGGKRGIASLCIGGGEATAVAVELID